MTEAETVGMFTTWLENDGWVVSSGPDKWLDIYATREGERLYAEVKGWTKDNGASADILWGQILRRMTDLGAPGVRYALVAPRSIMSYVLRVPSVVRERLGIELFAINEGGCVNPI
jgi:hypothetical protein